MTDAPRLTVYYDGACPRCIRDRDRYRRLAGARAESVQWVDVAGHKEPLRARGVPPEDALLALHVEDAHGGIHRGLDAYILLMRPVPALRPLAWVLGLPGIRQGMERLYRRSVRRRLARQGRLP
jgi:predicted DCC family thiol-disulfide oxidoreductase YuxK